MPNPNEFDNQEDWMQACIPAMIEEGKERDQAVAACASMWEERGQKTIDETLIVYGGAVKALGGGRIGGYLVRFSTDEDPDLEGEFFTKETDFGESETGVVYYQHGLDEVLKRRKIGRATHKMDEFGVWAEAQLDLRDKYERFIYSMAEKGKMGWSSGTAGHLVEREQRGKAIWLKSWPLGLDDTLTPIPAEPRNTAVPLKSWIPETAPTMPATTMAERIKALTDDANVLYGDLRDLSSVIDRPLSEVKRKELTELLTMFAGLDAVQSEFRELLTAQPTPRLVGPRLIGHDLAEHRKRFAHILKE
jgi:hypothetical protein